jgi:hypothetical protein
MFFSTYTPMVLYHVTPRSRLAQIRRRGLKPHVPGKVWGVCNPSTTRNKPVVWLTADPTTWHHSRHPNKALRNPNQVLLTVMINWSAPKLRHYMSWFDPHKKKHWLFCKNNLAAWFVYFDTDPAQTDYLAMTMCERGVRRNVNQI